MSKSLFHFSRISDTYFSIYFVGNRIGSFRKDKYSDRWNLNLNDLYWRDSQEICYEFEDYLAANA